MMFVENSGGFEVRRCSFFVGKVGSVRSTRLTGWLFRAVGECGCSGDRIRAVGEGSCSEGWIRAVGECGCLGGWIRAVGEGGCLGGWIRVRLSGAPGVG